MKMNALLFSKWLKIIILFLFFFVAIVFALRSCEPLPTTYSFNETTIFFPRQKPTSLFGSRDVPAAAYSGQLMLEDNCLRIKDDTSYALIWPPGYGLDFLDGTIQILDEAGHNVAHVGENIFVGGGVTPVTGVRAIDGAMQQEILDSCEGPYWFVGDVVRRIN
jgi:hypothetical protein